MIVKFVSSGDKKQAEVLHALINKRYIVAVLILSALVTILAIPVSSKLGMSTSVLIWIGPTIFFMFLYMVSAAFLQGFLKFGKVALLNIISVLIRLVLGIILLYLGFSIAGITVGILLSFLLTWLLGRHWAGFGQFNKKVDYSSLKKSVFKYSIPVFVTTLSMSLFIAVDVVMVKYFFDPFNSGLYASLSTLGKIIFYGAIPVTFVMFPLVAKRVADNKSSKKLFLISFFITIAIALGILLLFWLTPNFVVNMLFGEKYISASPMLGLFGIFSLFYTLDFFIANYFLSSGRVTASYLTPIGVIIQIVGIYLFHDSLTSVILASVLSTLSLFILLITYGLITKGKPKPFSYIATASEF